MSEKKEELQQSEQSSQPKTEKSKGSKKSFNPIKSLKASGFFKLLKERTTRFNSGSKAAIPSEYPINALARKLHPAFQFVKISKIEEHGPDCKTFTLSPDASRGTTELAYFASGQYVTVFITINGLKFARPYSLSSSPREAIGLSGFYQITVKSAKDGLVSNYILENWAVGAQLTISAPEGHFDYVSLRDAPTVIGIAGGSGITPFLSYAKSIVNGDEDFNLILLYGNRNKNSILFKDEFDRLQKQSSKIKVIHVLSDENALCSENAENEENGNNQAHPLGGEITENKENCENKEIYEKGFITASLIKKYAPATPYSIFLCGPQAMYNFADKEIATLGLEKKYIRHEMFGEIHSGKAQEGYPGRESAEVTITVTICDQVKTVKGNADDTILQILEKNGITVPNRCRSGECGWCHSLVKSGKVWVPAKMDFRRKADEKFNFIHPCCTFALSDLELDVPPAK